MFEAQRLPDRVHARFSSELAHIDTACKVTRVFLDESGLGELSFQLLVGLREALANAVMHGNGSDPALHVELTVQHASTPTAHELTVEVADEGAGFGWQGRLTDSGAAPPPEAESGRGLAIMRAFFDEISYNNAGNRITLRKSLPRQGANMTTMTKDNGTLNIKLHKDMVASSVDTYKQDFAEALDDDSIEHVVLDFSHVTMMDSLGMGLVVATHNSLQGRGADLALINVSADILSLLRTMRLDKHFSISGTN